ncbi:hypothetical protein [Nocardia wallacei]|uniref:hypothetical protein n=1 Tax=Nocardia wallacei TaxID=480035 RepID=UPI002455820D|nr:hypothetical protein [Nocardia wallacei]
MFTGPAHAVTISDCVDGGGLVVRCAEQPVTREDRASANGSMFAPVSTTCFLRFGRAVGGELGRDDSEGGELLRNDGSAVEY